MRIDIISVLPDLLHSPLQHSIVKRAQERSLVEINLHSLREYGSGNYKHVDDSPFGGGAGMVISPEPVFKCIENLTNQRVYDEVIFLTPDGDLFNQPMANQLSLKQNIILLCGHYKGVDERIREHLITREISIGDYVLTGGELGALVITDAIVRLIPGAINDEESALTDSFQDNLLSPPLYTRPAEFRGWKVPEILTSGNFKKIEEWQMNKAIEKTKNKRPDLLQ